MSHTSEQGTGKHPHKDTGEPWPYHQRSSSEQGEQSRTQESSSGEHERSRGGSSESADLSEREYRDEQGNVHHHTRTSGAMRDKDKAA
jgi:hypothetical protein